MAPPGERTGFESTSAPRQRTAGELGRPAAARVGVRKDSRLVGRQRRPDGPDQTHRGHEGLCSPTLGLAGPAAGPRVCRESRGDRLERPCTPGLRSPPPTPIAVPTPCSRSSLSSSISSFTTQRSSGPPTRTRRHASFLFSGPGDRRAHRLARRRGAPFTLICLATAIGYVISLPWFTAPPGSRAVGVSGVRRRPAVGSMDVGAHRFHSAAERAQ